MTTQIDTTEADRALKAKHRQVWAMGNYPAVVATIIPHLGATLVEAAGVTGGSRVLDIAAGTGNAAIPAALRGADVVASDLTPELLDVGREEAARAGAEIRWEVGDAEALPYPSDEFDTVLSCVGVMFAPHHQATADELLRVLRPAGTAAVLSWTPTGFIGQLFATMRPYVAPPPPGVQPPPLWGDENHVRGLFGDQVSEVVARTGTVHVDEFARPEDFLEFFKRNYGPTVAAYRGLADDPQRAAELDRDIVELVRRFDVGEGSTVMEWEYLLVTARKA
jgi:ubiquinone/menaquinone biosynthesis C-methylase UbiE